LTLRAAVPARDGLSPVAPRNDNLPRAHRHRASGRGLRQHSLSRQEVGRHLAPPWKGFEKRRRFTAADTDLLASTAL